MTDFLFDMVTTDSYPYLENFKNQEELNTYFGFEFPIKFENLSQESLNTFIDNWTTENGFYLMENNIADYDLDKGYVIREAVYKLNNKYYRMEYMENWCDPNEVTTEPYEVEQIITNQPVIKYIRK